MPFVSQPRVLLPHARPSRFANPGRRSTLRFLAWIAAASLAALVAWQGFTHPLSDLSAYGCWSIPDDASACTLGYAPAPQDQLLEPAPSVLPEHGGRAVLTQQALRLRQLAAMADPPASP